MTTSIGTYVNQALQRGSAVSTNRTAQETTSSTSSDMFYQLLSAQLQYQDPLESMDSSQMILQMAQFATIEALNNMTSLLSQSIDSSTIQSGASFVGKQVTLGLEDGTTLSGVVDSVGFTSQGTLLQVNGDYYDMWRVIEIGNPKTTSDAAPEAVAI